MSFRVFAEAFGLVIDSLIDDGRVHAVKTLDKPAKRNGRYLWTGTRGWAQNWATMAEVAVYKPDGPQPKPDLAQRRQRKEEDRTKHARAQAEAAAIIAECASDNHPYLATKGFPEAVGLVHTSGDLIIPMRHVTSYGVLEGVQRIDPDGGKKFLYGTRAKGAVFRIGNRGQRWLVEGYATGLSVHAALSDLKRTATVYVCFSAGNLIHVAERLEGPRFVFADHDESGTGQEAAKTTGLPWVMSPEIGDANDLHRSHGLRSLVKLILDL